MGVRKGDFNMLFILVLPFPILKLLQPGLRSIWEKYYEEAHAVIYVIDAACPSKFEDSKSALGR